MAGQQQHVVQKTQVDNIAFIPGSKCQERNMIHVDRLNIQIIDQKSPLIQLIVRKSPDIATKHYAGDTWLVESCGPPFPRYSWLSAPPGCQCTS